jgi:perosamine synthetase
LKKKIPSRQILYPGNIIKIFFNSFFSKKIDSYDFNKFFNDFFQSKKRNIFFPVNKARVGIFLIVKFLKQKFSKNKILMSPLTVFDVVNMVLCAGCNPEFIDFKKNSFDVDVEKLDKKLSSDQNICAVLICNYQINTNIDEVTKVAKKYNVEVILDCAISITSSLNNKSVVDYVNYSVFSFNLFKVIQCIHGGAIITSDIDFNKFLIKEHENWPAYNYKDLFSYFIKGLQIKILTLSFIYKYFTFNIFKYGDLKSIKFINNLSKNDPNPHKKNIINQSYKKQINNIQASEIYKNINNVFISRNEREKKFLLYEKNIDNSNIELFERRKNINEKNSYINFPLLIKNNKKKNFSEYLYTNNIDHSKYFYRSCDVIKDFKIFGADCVNSQFISNNIIILPIHDGVGEDDIIDNIKIINLF